MERHGAATLFIRMGALCDRLSGYTLEGDRSSYEYEGIAFSFDGQCTGMLAVGAPQTPKDSLSVCKGGPSLGNIWGRLAIDLGEGSSSDRDIRCILCRAMGVHPSEAAVGYIPIAAIVRRLGAGEVKAISSPLQMAIPMVAADGGKAVVAVANVNLLVVMPFERSMAVLPAPLSVKRTSGTVAPLIVGHRGFGMNEADRGAKGAVVDPSYARENTLRSFSMAADAGAAFIEFDVQLTRDRIPVIYHDFLMSEVPFAGISPHDILLRDFLRAGRMCGPHTRSRGADGPFGGEGMDCLSGSDGGDSNGSEEVITEDSFPTLKSAFERVDGKVGFNIELKYPVEEEVAELGMSRGFSEMNEFCDSILRVVFEANGRHADRRPVIFSSFHPDICLMLQRKQQEHPVYFLTDGGVTTWPSQPVSNSLASAIAFAGESSLDGVVCNVQALIGVPTLPDVLDEHPSLALFTYGQGNKNHDVVVEQCLRGRVDGIITDSIAVAMQAVRTAFASSG